MNLKKLSKKEKVLGQNKMKRKGLGKSQGQGYFNILNTDPAIHSMSAKGIKQKTVMNPVPKKPKIKPILNVSFLRYVTGFPESDKWYVVRITDKEEVYYLEKYDDGTDKYILSIRRAFPRHKQGAGTNTSKDLEWVVDVTVNNYSGINYPYGHFKKKSQAIVFLKELAKEIKESKKPKFITEEIEHEKVRRLYL
jgi:hypothetical protein